MEELIYTFLLRLGYPRASILFDVNLYEKKKKEGGRTVPTFTIVDPKTAVSLAVIHVVGPIDMLPLKQCAAEIGQHAARLDGKKIQAYVIRVNPQADSAAEKLQFFKVWPNQSLRQLTTTFFPDLDALRVARMLADPEYNAQETSTFSSALRHNLSNSSGDKTGDELNQLVTHQPFYRSGLYWPAIAMGLLCIIDLLIGQFGYSFLNTEQSILTFGAAFILTIALVVKYWRKA